MTKKYLYQIDEIINLEVNKIKDWFLQNKGIQLKNLKVQDLVFSDERPIYTGNGVYIFKEVDNIIYVGKCSSRNFVERVPAHFDIRHNGWFNSMLLRLIKRDIECEDGKYKTDENLEATAKYTFNNLELVLINFPSYDKNQINRLESLLRMTINPLNGYKTKRLNSIYKYVKDYINLIE